MTPPAAQDSSVNTPGSPGVSFGKTADGLVVALVGDTAFAMAAGRDGKHYLVTGWRIARPMDQWRRDDFYGHSGDLADEAAFRAEVTDNAEHQQEKRALGRRDIRSSANTPWGPSQGATVYAEGITCHSTAGHGGFHLVAERNRKVHSMLRVSGGWYEEDAEWAIVALTFPHLFTSYERKHADRTIRDSWPDAWQAIFGRVLESGECREKDRRVFECQHADDWIVVSALRSNHEHGFTEVIATRGGKRTEHSLIRRYLVPSDEYGVSGGPFGFVIDEARHRQYDGPSSFVGWQERAV
ncbi:DUF7007 domain-containing protein [Phyllobacterium sp. 22229]|uniref:DUF7007 domain-containing protein n=1 Tax=Agrobacterium radiobacter TaxID=362 RepID=A0ABD5LL92_AGRRD